MNINPATKPAYVDNYDVATGAPEALVSESSASSSAAPFPGVDQIERAPAGSISLSQPPAPAAGLRAELELSPGYDDEIATLRLLGYPPSEPVSEIKLTNFFLSKDREQEKKKKKKTLFGRLFEKSESKEERRAKSVTAQKQNEAIEAARGGTIASLFPGACYNGVMFTVGTMKMSRGEIKTALKITRSMEALLISILKANQSPSLSRGALSGGERAERRVRTPDGVEKVIPLCSVADQCSSVRDLTLTRTIQKRFLELAMELPAPPRSINSRYWANRHLKTDLIKLLSKREPVGLFELRALLPIRESGALVPESGQGSGKPAATFIGLTSRELITVATRLGAIELPESRCRN